MARPSCARPSGGHVEITRALLAHGCGDIDARNRDGRTALWWACHLGYANAALVLLQAGADMNIADTQGRTPLDMARAPGQHDCVAVLEVRTHTGTLDMVLAPGHEDCVAVLEVSTHTGLEE
jgi:ankyrin repeat protein